MMAVIKVPVNTPTYLFADRWYKIFFYLSFAKVSKLDDRMCILKRKTPKLKIKPIIFLMIDHTLFIKLY